MRNFLDIIKSAALWCVATPLKTVMTIFISLAIIITVIAIIGGGTDRLWKDESEVKIAVKGNLSQAIIEPAQIVPKKQWVTVEDKKGAMLCKPPATKYKIFSPARFVYLKVGEKKYGLNEKSPTTLQVEPGESIQFQVVDSKEIDGLLNIKFATGVVSGKDFYPRPAVFRVVYSEKPFAQAVRAQEVKNVASLLPDISGLSGVKAKAEDMADQVQKSMESVGKLEDEAVKEAQDWIKQNQDQLPKIDASDVTKTFQEWEGKKFRESLKKASRVNERLFHDPFFEKCNYSQDIGRQVRELVVQTILSLWEDPQIQEYLSDPSRQELVWEDIRVQNLLSNPEVRALLSDPDRLQRVLNDSRMRDVVNDPQVRALYKSRLAQN